MRAERGRSGTAKNIKSRGIGSPISTNQTDKKLNSSFTPISINYISLGSRLKEERKRLLYTQEEVAELIGVTPAFIGHIERGERGLSFETLVNICALLGVTIDYVLTDILPLKDDVVSVQIRNMLKNKTSEQKSAILDIMKAVTRNM